MLGGNPLGDMHPWGMTYHRAGAYAQEASYRAGANKRNGSEGCCDGSPPSINEDGLIGDLHTAALTLSTVQDQTGGNEDGLFVRVVWGTFPAARAADPLDRQAGPRRRGIQHVHLAAARHHLPPFYDPDLRDRVCPWRRVDGMGIHLGHHRLIARYRPLGSQLHPARPDTRAELMRPRQPKGTTTKREGGEG